MSIYVFCTWALSCKVIALLIQTSFISQELSGRLGCYSLMPRSSLVSDFIILISVSQFYGWCHRIRQICRDYNINLLFVHVHSRVPEQTWLIVSYVESQWWGHMNNECLYLSFTCITNLHEMSQIVNRRHTTGTRIKIYLWQFRLPYTNFPERLV